MPRLILIAPRFSDNYVNLAMYSTLNRDGLLELKECSVIQIPGGEQTIITRLVNLHGPKQDLELINQGQSQENVELANETNGETKNFAIVGKNTAMIAHDLKNPIQVLLNGSYNMRQEYEGSDLQTKAVLQKSGVGLLLGIIEKQIDYMNRLISDMQSLTTDVKPKIAEASLAELIKDVTSNLPPSIKTSIEIGIDKNNFDYYLMKRALINLVMNSVQAMPEGGNLLIKTFAEGVMFVIQVRDSGVGIPKDIMDNLFSSFATTKMNGAGMGLISAKKIIDAHKGTISVESEVGKGTMFTIRIPETGQI
jgi:signal transduction histidine kinase